MKRLMAVLALLLFSVSYVQAQKDLDSAWKAGISLRFGGSRFVSLYGIDDLIGGEVHGSGWPAYVKRLPDTVGIVSNIFFPERHIKPWNFEARLKAPEVSLPFFKWRFEIGGNYSRLGFDNFKSGAVDSGYFWKNRILPPYNSHEPDWFSQVYFNAEENLRWRNWNVFLYSQIFRGQPGYLMFKIGYEWLKSDYSTDLTLNEKYLDDRYDEMQFLNTVDIIMFSRDSTFVRLKGPSLGLEGFLNIANLFGGRLQLTGSCDFSFLRGTYKPVSMARENYPGYYVAIGDTTRFSDGDHSWPFQSEPRPHYVPKFSLQAGLKYQWKILSAEIFYWHSELRNYPINNRFRPLLLWVGWLGHQVMVSNPPWIFEKSDIFLSGLSLQFQINFDFSSIF